MFSKPSGGAFIGINESADDQGATNISEEIYVFAEEEESRYHSDQRLDVKIIVGSNGSEYSHDFVPDDVCSEGAHSDEEHEIEENFGLREVEESSDLDGFLLIEK